MKINKIERIAEARNVAEAFAKAGVEYHVLENVNWTEQYPYCPEVKVAMAHDGDNLYIHYQVKEQSVRAVAEADQGRVWEDSCVEFFVQPNPEDGIYYNFECNCAAKLLLCAGAERHDRERVPKEVTDAVERWSSLGNEPFEERVGDVEWNEALIIPKTSFFKHMIPSFDGLKIKGNVYKCGDLQMEAHFVSLFPITTEKPDYHRPEYFQEITID